MGVVGVADVEGAGAVVGVLVGGGAADAEGGVGAGDDYDFAFYSTANGRVPCQRPLLSIDKLARGGE